MPISISQTTKDTLKQNSVDGSPYEVCGIIYDDTHSNTQYITMITNISEQPEEYFLFDPVELVYILDNITSASNLDLNSYFHSHVNATEQPSLQDKMTINKLNQRMLIYSIYTDNFLNVDPVVEDYPLVGRQFNYATANCYTLVQDYYEIKRSITLSDYTPIPNWWNKGMDLFLTYIPDEGFSEVSTLQEHDVILMQVDSPVPNHLGIYIGDNKMIHHPLDRLSQRIIYGGYWRKHTWGYYRR